MGVAITFMRRGAASLVLVSVLAMVHIPADAGSIPVCSAPVRLYATIGGFISKRGAKVKPTSVIARLFLLDRGMPVGNVYIDDIGFRWVDFRQLDRARRKNISKLLKLDVITRWPASLAEETLFEGPLSIGPCSEPVSASASPNRQSTTTTPPP
jgi:hypothetical protein